VPEQNISLASYARLVRGNRNFRRLWTAQIISEVGDWFYMVALYAMLLEFTGSAQVLGLAFVLQVLPQALTGPLAGVVNDRLRRKRVMITSDIARAAIVSCMLLVRSPAMVWLAYPLLALETVMWGLFEPARNAVIPNIVAENEIVIANTLCATTWSMNLFLGAALGGVAAAFLGRDTVFVLNGLSFIASALLISGTKFSEPHAESHKEFRLRDLVNFSDMAEGVRYIRSRPRLAAAVFVKAGLAVTGASWVIFPIMGRSVFPITGPGIAPERAALLGMSALMGARGLGALLGPILIAPWAQQKVRRLQLCILTGFLLYGCGYIALGLLRHAFAAYAVVVVSHIGGASVWVFSTTLLQLLSDDKFRGRVFSADLSFCTLMLAMTAYAAGFAIDHGLDVRLVAIATGLLTVFSGALWFALGMRRGAEPGAVAA